MHSHLLPGIDDGVKTWEESLEILTQLHKWGFRGAITTPHILSDYYPNSAETILPLLAELRVKAAEAGLDMHLEAAAEYYVDERFMEMLRDKEELLSFGPQNYVLFETSYMNMPAFLKEALFTLSSQGYRPVMAHPERYAYLQEQPQLIGELADRVTFQVNTLSLIGYYAPASKKLAQRLLKSNLIGFLGSDLHRPKQLAALSDALQSGLYRKITEAGISNESLI